MPQQIRGGRRPGPAHHEILRCRAGAEPAVCQPHLLCHRSGWQGAVHLHRPESGSARSEHHGRSQAMEGCARALIVAGTLWLSTSIAAPAAGSPTASGPAAGQLEEIEVVGERPGPRLWKVTRGDHVLWVLGTLNHVPRKMIWRPTEVEAVLDQSQQVLASGPSVSSGLGPIAMIRLYFQWRSTQKNPSRTQLKDWLPAPLYARFEVLKERFDPHDSSIEELRPSFAALRLYEKAVEVAGLTGRDEVEHTVLKLA